MIRRSMCVAGVLIATASCGQASTSLPSKPPEVVQVALGSDYGCALFDDGAVQCWGSNSNGQTGRDVPNTEFPGIVVGVTMVAQMAIGQATVVRSLDGTVWGWGYNGAGQLGLNNFGGATPATIDELFGAEQISTSIQTCALRRSVVTCVGIPLDGSEIGHAEVQHFSGRGVRIIADGCFVMSDGSLECWGPNSDGEVGVGDKKPRATPTAVRGIDGVGAVAIGGNFTCALREDGLAYCWGDNSTGQLGTGDTKDRLGPEQPVVAVPPLSRIAAGLDHACGLGADGRVYCWGGDGTDQLGFSERFLDPNPTPRAVPGLSDVVDISAGTWDTCAIKRDHSVWCWGENTSGALGAGFASDVSAKPLQVKFQAAEH